MKNRIAFAIIAIGFLAAPMLVSAADKKEAAKPYPLETCIISGDKLGEMGDPYVFTYKGQEIKLCCKSCQKDFKKDPARYLKKIEEAAKSDKKADKK